MFIELKNKTMKKMELENRNQEKKSLKDLFSSFEVSKIQSKFISGGQTMSSNCGECMKETAGSTLGTWVDTPSDCGVDPDQCDPDCAMG